MQNKFKLKIFDIDSPISEKEFLQFISLMEEAFPKEERRTREAFYELCRGCSNYKIHSFFDDEKLVAFFTLWEFESFRFGDHFAVASSERSKGIGAHLLSKVLYQSPLPFILEVEPDTNEIAARRINFYLRNGFVKNDFPYLLPPMQEGCDAIPMYIMSYPKALSECDFVKMRDTLYKNVYNGFKE